MVVQVMMGININSYLTQKYVEFNDACMAPKEYTSKLHHTSTFLKMVDDIYDIYLTCFDILIEQKGNKAFS